MEQDHLILKYLQGSLSGEERADFERWMNQSQENQRKVDDLQRVWRVSDLKETHLDFETASEWQKLQATINETPTFKLNPKSFGWRIAASIAFVFLASIALYFAFFRSNEIVYQTTNQTRRFILPDSSEVWLNEKSKLIFQKDFNDQRNVTLEGEAFFNVKRDPKRPFVIQADEAMIKVLGTSFNVKAYRERAQIEVYVVTGKVHFTTRDENSQLILTAGLNGVLNKENRIISTAMENPNSIAWKNKALVFKKTPLREVLNTVQNYFKTSIKVKNEDLLNCRFTSAFKDPTLEEVIEAISLSLNLQVDHQSNVYTLDGAGCYPK
jgi:transmembrane sensor